MDASFTAATLRRFFLPCTEIHTWNPAAYK
jgi:hypothetical protein